MPIQVAQNNFKHQSVWIFTAKLHNPRAESHNVISETTENLTRDMYAVQYKYVYFPTCKM